MNTSTRVLAALLRVILMTMQENSHNMCRFCGCGLAIHDHTGCGFFADCMQSAYQMARMELDKQSSLTPF